MIVCPSASQPPIQVIDLNDNTFTEPGSTAMAEVLPSLQEVRVLNFGECLVRSGGATAIAEAIKDGHKLLEVHTMTCIPTHYSPWYVYA